MTTLAVYDVTQRRLPNALTLPGAATVLIAALIAGRGWPAFLGAVVLMVPYLIVHVIAPAAMGAGDVKLAIGVGALSGAFGVDAWVLAAIAAPLLTALWGIVTVTARRASASDTTGQITVPHGPSMCIATVAAVALVVV